MRQVARAWQRVLLVGLRVIVGLTHEVRGREHIPLGPVVIACKHQSAWETVACHALLDEIAVALKEELTRIPVFGWYLLRAGSIRIDRGAAAGAIRSLIAGARREVALGVSVLIFPEGTRREPGCPARLQARAWPRSTTPCGCRWCRSALNSGLYWRRRGFIKYPGPDRARVPAADPARSSPAGVHAASSNRRSRPPRRGWWRRAPPVNSRAARGADSGVGLDSHQGCRYTPTDQMPR